jgi:hypothetical protein
MSEPIAAHGAGLADEEPLVPFPFLATTTTRDHDGGEDAEILERQ